MIRRPGRLGRRLGALAALAAALLASGLWVAPALACTVCYGEDASGSAMLTAARLGVFVLLGITVAMLGGFAKFFFYLRNRARQAESEEIASEWAHLQRSSST
jgi:hypothetical protein